MTPPVQQPPAAALRLLAVFVPDAEREPVEGDLQEEYQSHPSAAWFWGQVLRSLSHFSWISMKRAPGRTVLAMFAGYAVAAICVMASFAALGTLHLGETRGILMATELGGGMLSAIAGGYCAARIARGRGIHGMIALCIFTLLMGIVSFVSTVQASARYGVEPMAALIHELELISVFLLGVLLGGYLRARQLAAP